MNLDTPFLVSDDGDLMTDAAPARCPHCQRWTDVGSVGELDVVRCAFCRSRTHFLWSDRRDMAVPEFRGRNADWCPDDDWEELWRDYDFDDDCGEGDEGCVNGCVDPIFDAPAELVCDGRRWVCPVCGSDGEDEEED